MGYFFGATCTCSGGGAGTSGAYLSIAVAAGATNNLAPNASWPYSSGQLVNRLDIDPSSGNANVTGLEAGLDGQGMLIRNPDAANQLTLNVANGGSAAANQFAGPADVILPPGASVPATYYKGSVAKWVLTP